MSKLKKKQHYVWKNYLKPWSTNGQILCNRKNKIFNTSLENIGEKRFFYESIPLNKSELDYVTSFFRIAHPSAIKYLSELLKLYIITSDSNEYTKKCGIEDFHSLVESNAIIILEKIYNKDLTFFEDSELRKRFGFFIGCQYTRTSNMRDRISQAPLKVSSDISKEKISKVYSLYFADMIGSWIYLKSKIRLIFNNSDSISFITSDQPIINTRADSKGENPPTEFELFYPITPQIAISISENDSPNEVLNEMEVKNYNKLITEHSYEQLYAKNINDFN
jgi:hypothetical protein